MGDNTNEPDGEVAGATAESDKNVMSSKEEHTTSEATDPDGGTKGEESFEVEGESPETGGAEDEKQTLPDTAKQNGTAEVAAAEDTANEKAKEDTYEKEPGVASSSSSVSVPIVSSSKKSRPPYKYDPEKITLRFLFANRDGLTVTVECRPGDTVGEVKGALLSVWPSGM
jgi:hypothetical protein